MSFREKISWISLVTMTGVYGWYIWRVMPPLAAAHGAAAGSTSLLVGTIVVLVVLQIVLNVAAAIQSPQDARAPEDERERLIRLKGSGTGFVVLVIGAIAACVAGIYFHMESVLLGNAIFLAVVVAHIAKYLTEIVYYRRGA